MHVIVDLGTMGKAPRGAITEIGAAAFDQREVLSTFHEYVLLARQPREIEASTVLWWAMQDAAARERMVDGQRFHAEPYDIVLRDFRDWLDRNPLSAIWSHGKDFDLEILKDAYEQTLGDSLPRDWRLGRDTRTLFALVGGAPELPFEGTKHSALDDAIHRAKQIQAAYAMLGRSLDAE